MSCSHCCFLTCIQVSQEAGKAVWYSYLLKNFPQFVVIHRVKGFGLINKPEIDVFLGEGNGTPLHSILAWKIPWTEEPGGLQSMGLLRVGHDWATSLSLSLSCIGEGHGNPLQHSCLENPRNGGAWWAAIYGVAQSWTWLKRLSSSSSSRCFSGILLLFQWSNRCWQCDLWFLCLF